MVWILCAGAIVVAALRWFDWERSSEQRVVGTVASTRSTPRAGGSAARPDVELTVQVSGLVRRPGVYRVRPGARVFELIRLAGGVRSGGDAQALQLAARLVDGVRIEVPRAPGRRAAAGEPATGPTGDGGASGPLSLASATAEQLERLDGIGPALARRIVEWREGNGGFSSVADLDRVPGIGPAKFAAIKDEVVP